MASDDLRSDLFGIAVRRQVGAGEEHLAAPGRDRHEAVEVDRVADRPGRDDENEAGEEDAGLRECSAPSATSADEDDHGDQHRHAQVLGPGQRQPSEQHPGQEPGCAPVLSRRPEHRQDRSREQGRRQRLAHQHALVLEQGRVDRDRPGADQAGSGTGEAAADQVGEEDGESADQRKNDTRRALVDAASELIEAGDEKRQPGGVVAGGLGRVGVEREALAMLQARGDLRVGGRVEDRLPAVPGVVEAQTETQQQDRDQDREADRTAVALRQPAHRPDAMRLPATFRA